MNGISPPVPLASSAEVSLLLLGIDDTRRHQRALTSVKCVTGGSVSANLWSG